MKFDQILTEEVSVHGIALFAYAVTIAEAYDALPVFDPAALPAWEALIASDDHFAKQILGNIKVEFIPQDPTFSTLYKNLNDMLNDVTVNKHLSVFKTPEDTKHSGMTVDQNNTFRMVHDVLGHLGVNSDTFYAHLLKQDAGTPYKPLWGGSFTVKGEMNAYLKHAAIAPTAAIPALFTEVVGQICTFFTTGDYTINKTAIMDEVDFKHVGVCSGSKAARMHDIISQYNDPTLKTIETSIDGVNIDKSKIRWKLLSPGTGAGNIT